MILDLLNSVSAHHALTRWVSPMRVWSILFALSVLIAVKSRTNAALCLSLVAGAFLWVFACGATSRLLGRFLEGPYPFRIANELPKSDAIVVLGGGVGAMTAEHPYPRLNGSADRVMYAVWLWRNGRAPVIVLSGRGERLGAYPLVKELGVPDHAVVVEDNSEDTEENAREVGAVLPSGTKILLVTSAWHMRRSLLLFRLYATDLKVIPAAADHMTPRVPFWKWPLTSYFPSPDALGTNSMMVKECLGCLWYRLLGGYITQKAKARKSDAEIEE